MVFSLRAYFSIDQQKWPKFLSGIMMSFRKAVSFHSTEYAPFHWMFGEDMRISFDADLILKDNLGRNTKQYLEDLL